MTYSEETLNRNRLWVGGHLPETECGVEGLVIIIKTIIIRRIVAAGVDQAYPGFFTVSLEARRIVSSVIIL